MEAPKRDFNFNPLQDMAAGAFLSGASGIRLMGAAVDRRPNGSPLLGERAGVRANFVSNCVSAEDAREKQLF